MNNWITCPDCAGTGWSEAVYEYVGGLERKYVDPCRRCRGVKEIYMGVPNDRNGLQG
jgi:DnaJ-class molecular chaperone